MADLRFRPQRLVSPVVLGALVATALVGAARPAAAFDASTYTTLGTLGGSDSWGSAVNDQGWVTGSSYTAQGDIHAFLWRNGAMQDLGTLGGTTSSGTAINNRGWVVGSSTTADGSTHAFVFRDGVMSDLGTLGGADSSAADINDQGLVVGAAGGYAAWWKSGAGGLLDNHGDYSSTEAVAVSNSGLIAGNVTGSQGPLAATWSGTAGAMTLLAKPPGDWGSQAVDVNDAGVVVGDFVQPCDEGGYCFMAGLWRNSVLIDSFPGGWSTGINIRNVVTFTYRSFGWVRWRDGETTNLQVACPPGSCELTATSAYDINSRGDVAGSVSTWTQSTGWRGQAALWRHSG